MNIFIEAGIRVIEQAMADIDIRLDKVEELADEAAQTFQRRSSFKIY